MYGFMKCLLLCWNRIRHVITFFRKSILSKIHNYLDNFILSACSSCLQDECTQERHVQQVQGCNTEYLEISSKCKFNGEKTTTKKTKSKQNPHKENKTTQNRPVPHTVPLLTIFTSYP